MDGEETQTYIKSMTNTFNVNTIQLLKFAFTFIGIKYGHNAYNMDFTFQRASVHILSLCLASSESYLNS